MTYADLMKLDRDWTYKKFEAAQRMHSSKLGRGLDFPLPRWSAHQMVDGKVRLYFRDQPNKLLSNFFASLFAQTNQGVASIPSGAVDDTGTVQTANNQNTNGSNIMTTAGTNAPANFVLGTDTATATVRAMWKLVSAITHLSGTVSGSVSTQSVTQQGKTYNQVLNQLTGYSFAAGATSGNPTLGEVMGTGTVNISTTSVIAGVSRLAAADAAFTAFTITSSLTLALNWKIIAPTT